MEVVAVIYYEKPARLGFLNSLSVVSRGFTVRHPEEILECTWSNQISDFFFLLFLFLVKL